jgi:aminoglycoside phosphotransferase (APT) family kinase protein
MSAVGQEANAGTGQVRKEHRFDEGALERWMALHVPDFAGPLTVAQFKGGQSNPTYQLLTPGRSYVLRRKPPGPILQGAHAVEREARVLTALGRVGFPVPHVYALCTDEQVIGTHFFVMEHVGGRIFWDATFPQAQRQERRAYFDAMNDTLARLHGLDPAVIGLEDYGKPGNYFARQIGRWSKQYLQDADAGRDPDMDWVLHQLSARVPAEDPTALVHGDFRCDNLIMHPTEPRVIAVLDWELSTLGNPLADFAYHAMMYRMPPDIVAGLAGADLAALGIPSESEYVDDYCDRTGRASIPDYDFYLAFNFFRMAAIFHGIKGRVLRGTAASSHARERAKSFPTLARLARRTLEEGR